MKTPVQSVVLFFLPIGEPSLLPFALDTKQQPQTARKSPLLLYSLDIEQQKKQTARKRFKRKRLRKHGDLRRRVRLMVLRQRDLLHRDLFTIHDIDTTLQRLHVSSIVAHLHTRQGVDALRSRNVNFGW